MTTAKKVIKIEKSYVRSEPYGAYNVFNGRDGQPWCGYFQKYCLSKAGSDLKKWIDTCSNPAYVPEVENWARRNGRWTHHGKPGDLVLFGWNSNKSPDHIGMLIKKLNNGLYMTVEGNTSNVSQGNGGCVQIRYREAKWILGFVRPPYKKSKEKKTTGEYTGAIPTTMLQVGSSGSEVKKWQKFLKWAGEGVKVDGQFGAMTRRATIDFQKKVWLTADGIVGKNTVRAAKTYKK